MKASSPPKGEQKAISRRPKIAILPMFQRLAAFVTPTAVVLLAFSATVAAIQAVHIYRSHGSMVPSDDFGPDAGDELARVDLSRIVLPRPSLSPREVVELQLSGLKDQTGDGIGIVQCYSLASPGNRSVTGPLERFGKLVRSGPFHVLASPRAVLIGHADVEGAAARLLVTLVDENFQIQAFTWVLGRQPAPPFQDCWMTEGVFPSAAPPATEPPPGDSNRNA